MANQAVEVDRTVDRLADALVRVLENGEGAGELFAPDAFFDLNVPAWRFLVQHPEAFVDWWHEEVDRKGKVTVSRLARTTAGFVVETEIEFPHQGRDLIARQILLAEVVDGRISELVVFCTGDWDPETRARHVAEAPMIRR